jgi:4-hydroxy-3-polyprenylbenzoate decarboxylase
MAHDNLPVSRRRLLAAGAALGALPLTLSTAQVAAAGAMRRRGPTAPFDSLRDYVAALEARGLLLRFRGVDQDAYEATGILYALIEEFGMHEAPAVMFEDIRANGRMFPGPVLANTQGHMDTESILFGIEPHPRDVTRSYRAARTMLLEQLERSAGVYTLIEPLEIPPGRAPCKDIRLTGDDIDVTAFPFLKGNPGDGGPYINTASVFTRDPEMGVNLGTYRCQVRGPRKVMVNFEEGQTGYRMVMAAKERGETTVKVALVIGQDPMTWMVSSSRVPNRIGNRKPIDELAISGGLRGRAIEVVRTEGGEFQVPAHAEIVIEGTVDIVNLEPEGPYHEMYGYMGIAKDKNYVMRVEALTHRRNPWVMNSFTGVVSEYCTAAQAAASVYTLRKSHPQVVDYHSPHDSQGLTYISIRKDAPGQGLKVAQAIASFNPLSRIVIVVDDDIDILDSAAVRFAIGSRWQPATATEILKDKRAFSLDPGSPDRKTTSKAIIDATRQWPAEGGPPVYQELNRTVLERAVPGVVERVKAKWPRKLLRERRF